MQKLSRIKIKLETKEGHDLSYCKGSIFQGALMQMIDSDYASVLHESNLHPYSQYIEKLNDEVFWVINCTNNQASENIISSILQKDSIFLEKMNTEYKFLDKVYEEITYDSLVKSFYREDASKYITLKIKTPMSFKSNGEYCIFPEVRKIYKSLMNKYDSAMKDEDSCLFDLETLDELCEKTKIIRYSLRTNKFPLEGVSVTAFIGTITLKISAPQTLVNFANMLFKFGEFSGIGIKNSVGMGAISIETKDSKDGGINYVND